MDTGTVVIVVAVIALALACQASESGGSQRALRFVVVTLTVFLLLNGAATLLAALAGQQTSSALGLDSGGDRSRLAAEGALTTAAGAVTLVLFAAGTRSVPGLRRLRPGAPISWLALSLFLQSLASNLAPSRAEATVSATVGSPEKASNLILNAIPFAVIGIAAVGPGVRRGFAPTLRRLGALPLRPPWWGVGVAAGALLVLLGNPAVDALSHLSPADCVAQQQQVAQSLEGQMRTVAEQLGIAIAAGVSEEVLFRGALQPRFGILLSSLLWASFHLQYTCHGFPSVANLYILTLGLIFGALRNRGGLLAAVVAHVTYDASILLQASDGTLVAIAAVGAAAGAVVAQVPLGPVLRGRRPPPTPGRDGP